MVVRRRAYVYDYILMPPHEPAHAQTAAQRKRAQKDRENLVLYRNPADAARRAGLEAERCEWLRWYFPERFYLPFSSMHRELVENSYGAMIHGTSTTVAATRGFGKTGILWAMALYGVLTGIARFPVVVGWKREAGSELLEQWLTALAQNERLRADYPCVCDCFAESTQSKRLQSLLRGIDPRERCGCDVRKMRGVVVLPAVKEPDGRELPQAALAGASINGAIKGLNVGLLNGEALRPDIVLPDDPQDDDAAESPTIVAKIIRRIDFTLRSLSGPQRRLTVMAAVTCVNNFDVSTALLNRPGTRSIRVGQVKQWPKDWNKKDSKSRAAWDEWNRVRLEGLDEKNDGGDAARKHYRKNRATLKKGFEITWPERFHAGDEERPADPDALFTTMWEFYDLGEAAFMAERQNEPMKEDDTVYDLNADIVQSKVHPKRKRGEIPEQARLLIASSDINHYGIHTVIIAFGNDQTAWVAWYGVYDKRGAGLVPKNCPEREAKQRIAAALDVHGRELVSVPLVRGDESVRLGGWFIDAGYMPDVVRGYIEGPGRIVGVQVFAVRGYSGDKYRPTGKNVIGVPREECHLSESAKAGQFIAFNACYWREVSQKAWLAVPNSPGSLSLYQPRHRTQHAEFAQQVTREKLVEKLQGRYGALWRWHTAPGKHDYGDGVTNAYVGAAWSGIGTVAQPERAKKKRRRRIRHVPI